MLSKRRMVGSSIEYVSGSGTSEEVVAVDMDEVLVMTVALQASGERSCSEADSIAMQVAAGSGTLEEVVVVDMDELVVVVVTSFSREQSPIALGAKPRGAAAMLLPRPPRRELKP